MKVYSRRDGVLRCLGTDELWTVDLSKGARFSEKEARALVADFKRLERSWEFSEEKGLTVSVMTVWCR